MSGKYPNAFYRVSVKAVIRNEKNEYLLVREWKNDWSFVGGGIDHGETVHDALKRELYEEALIDAPFEEKFVEARSIWLPDSDMWALWLFYEINIENLKYGLGADADEIKFIDPASFKDSEFIFEQVVYEYSQRH
jgi:8-oxo-dGTP diphosphatase